jgi:hypothetical protein
VLFKQQGLNRNLFWQYGKQTAVRSGNWKLVNGTELYNLQNDISESNNVSAQHPEVVKQLKELFAKEEEHR